MKRWSLGVDIGSVTVKLVLLDEKDEVRYDSYKRTMGAPLEALQSDLNEVKDKLPADAIIASVGTTGSGRFLAGAFVGADIIKNEITTHAVGALSCRPDLRTIIEIGGQDSKFISLDFLTLVLIPNLPDALKISFRDHLHGFGFGRFHRDRTITDCYNRHRISQVATISCPILDDGASL